MQQYEANWDLVLPSSTAAMLAPSFLRSLSTTSANTNDETECECECSGTPEVAVVDTLTPELREQVLSGKVLVEEPFVLVWRDTVE